MYAHACDHICAQHMYEHACGMHTRIHVLAHVMRVHVCNVRSTWAHALCMCASTCITCMQVHTHVRKHMCTYTCVRKHICVGACTHTHVCTCMHVSVHAHAHRHEMPAHVSYEWVNWGIRWKEHFLGIWLAKSRKWDCIELKWPWKGSFSQLNPS